MRARDVMTTAVVTVGPDMGIAELARLMLERRISGVPVVDGGGRVIGIVSEGDLMRRAELATGGVPWWAADPKPAEERARAYSKAHGMKVADVMTRDVVSIDENAPLDRIAMLLESRGIKRVPVLRDGKLVGIVSRANLLQGIAAGAGADPGPDDEAIRAAILATARGEAGVRASLVDVTVAKGVAHLWGNVATEAERDALRICAEKTRGVREVRDHLRVMPHSILALDPE